MSTRVAKQRKDARAGLAWERAKTILRYACWLVSAPVLAYPYFVWGFWVASMVPNSATVFDSSGKLLAQSAAVALFSIALLPFTAFFICATLFFLTRWSSQYLDRPGQIVLNAFVVGWLHCFGYILLTESGWVQFNLFN